MIKTKMIKKITIFMVSIGIILPIGYCAWKGCLIQETKWAGIARESAEAFKVAEEVCKKEGWRWVDVKIEDGGDKWFFITNKSQLVVHPLYIFRPFWTLRHFLSLRLDAGPGRCFD